MCRSSWEGDAGWGPLGPAPPSFFLVPSEQVLHLWLEVLCSSLPTVEKWYQPWSFLRSPGWVQIKCELRWVSGQLCRAWNLVLEAGGLAE